jgi:hypothetical protein
MFRICGGLIVWRGVRVMDEFLIVGFPIVAMGLDFMGVVVWLIHRGFLKPNSWRVARPLALLPLMRPHNCMIPL